MGPRAPRCSPRCGSLAPRETWLPPALSSPPPCPGQGNGTGWDGAGRRGAGDGAPGPPGAGRSAAPPRPPSLPGRRGRGAVATEGAGEEKPRGVSRGGGGRGPCSRPAQGGPGTQEPLVGQAKKVGRAAAPSRHPAQHRSGAAATAGRPALLPLLQLGYVKIEAEANASKQGEGRLAVRRGVPGGELRTEPATPAAGGFTRAAINGPSACHRSAGDGPGGELLRCFAVGGTAATSIFPRNVHSRQKNPNLLIHGLVNEITFASNGQRQAALQ